VLPRSAAGLLLLHVLLEYASAEPNNNKHAARLHRYQRSPLCPLWTWSDGKLAVWLRVLAFEQSVAGVCRSLSVAEEHIATVTEESMGSAEGDVVWAVVRSGLHFPTDVSLWEGWRAEWLERLRRHDEGSHDAWLEELSSQLALLDISPLPPAGRHSGN